MSHGNPIVKTRIPREMHQEMNDAIAKRNYYTREEPWDVSAFIRKAIREKLDHMRRSRTAKRRPRQQP